MPKFGANLTGPTNNKGLVNSEASWMFQIQGESNGAITTGVKGDFEAPYNATIVGWSLLEGSGTSGSIVIDIWKDTYANHPPTVADTITASAKPTISSAQKGQSSTLTGWTTAVTKGDILRFNVDSITSCKIVTLVLKVIKT